MEHYFQNSHGILYQGDNRDLLPCLDDNSVDLMVTDPPFGISFMGRNWDKAVPPVDTWKECLRVLKPGAFAFIMCIPRQDCQAKMIVNLAEAGFDISFTSLCHTYSQGFIKAHNIAKELDKRLGMAPEKVRQRTDGRGKWEAKMARRPGSSDSGVGHADGSQQHYWETSPVSPEAQELAGSYSNFSPKPALEFVLVVQKSFTGRHRRSDVYSMLDGKYDYWYTARTEVTEKSISQVTDKWGDLLPRELVVGDVIERRLALTPEFSDAVLLNRCDVLLSKPYKDTYITSSITHALATGKGISWLGDGKIPTGEVDLQGNPVSRCAPNLLVSGDILNDGIHRKSGARLKGMGGEHPSAIYGKYHDNSVTNDFGGDSGSYSRYFSLDAWSVEHLPESVLRTYPFFLVSKPSPKEKNSGLDGRAPTQANDGRQSSIDNPYQRGDSLRRNTHTTVKSLTLMAYLITIGSRPNDVILDPFSGSGSTLIAAALLHRLFVGMELEEEYCDITERRLWHFTQHREQMNFDILLNGKSP